MNGHSVNWNSAEEAADSFLRAVRTGDDVLLWSLFSTQARQFIVERARRKGLTSETAADLLSDAADEDVRRGFIADLMAGVTKDLENVRVERIRLGDSRNEADSVTIDIVEVLVTGVGPELPPLPVASLVLSLEETSWRVDRLIPRPGQH
ncbi:MAG: hypothetical protein HKN91_14050 [Acidimicrobiia bacterium]|nr:hypothetical protein [Acidimicrobiia bacterium]